VSHLNKG